MTQSEAHSYLIVVVVVVVDGLNSFHRVNCHDYYYYNSNDQKKKL
jgi:hypothetical protein